VDASLAELADSLDALLVDLLGAGLRPEAAVETMAP
jgi:hypothetical protein